MSADSLGARDRPARDDHGWSDHQTTRVRSAGKRGPEQQHAGWFRPLHHVDALRAVEPGEAGAIAVLAAGDVGFRWRQAQ
jgi:hypothetical protein